ncbi:MAG: flagellin [Myxococcota bacterium]
MANHHHHRHGRQRRDRLRRQRQHGRHPDQRAVDIDSIDARSALNSAAARSATMNQLGKAIDNLGSTVEGLLDADGNIRDVDVASESANLSPAGPAAGRASACSRRPTPPAAGPPPSPVIRVKRRRPFQVTVAMEEAVRWPRGRRQRE